MTERPAKILVAAEDDRLRERLRYLLTDLGHQVTGLKDGELALRYLDNESFDVLILSFTLPPYGALRVLEIARERHSQVGVLVIAEPGNPTIVMRRAFDAPRELVYRAYADPDLLKQWMGPDRLEMRIDEYELRHGGRYRFVHIDTDGTEYAFRGVFHGDQGIDSSLA